MHTAIVAITVSPAPVTSKTSFELGLNSSNVLRKASFHFYLMLKVNDLFYIFLTN